MLQRLRRVPEPLRRRSQEGSLDRRHVCRAKSSLSPFEALLPFTGTRAVPQEPQPLKQHMHWALRRAVRHKSDSQHLSSSADLTLTWYHRAATQEDLTRQGRREPVRLQQLLMLLLCKCSIASGEPQGT